MSNIPQLAVRSIPLRFTPRFSDLSHFISEKTVVWKHLDSYLLGFGVTARREITNCEDFAATDGNCAAKLSPQPPNRFHIAKSWWHKLRTNAEIIDEMNLPGSGLIAFGSFSFDAKSAVGSVLIVPQLVVATDRGSVWITQIWQSNENAPKIPTTAAELAQQISQISEKNLIAHKSASEAKNFAEIESDFDLAHGIRDAIITARPTPEVWMQSVASASKLIQRGELEKVVLSRCIEAALPQKVSTAKLVQELACAYPSTWVFSIDGLIGASPEMLVETDFTHSNSHQIHCRVLAGTKPLAVNEAALQGMPNTAHTSKMQDFSLETSTKDLHEHRVAVESAVAILEEFGTVKSGESYVLNLPNVAHLATDIFTEINTEFSVLDVIAKLHPTAALGGNPREKALQLISLLEPTDRERYGAPVGWIASGAAGEFGQWAIALRCCKIGSNLQTVKAWAGGGIMAESVPSEELAETRAKFAPILNALKAQYT